MDRVATRSPAAAWPWPAGWFVLGVGVFTGEALSQPGDGPLWATFALGALGWGLAGGAAARVGGTRRLVLAAVWAALCVASLFLGFHWGNVLEGLGHAGFVGLAGSTALAGAVGGLATHWLEGRGLVDTAIWFPVWGVLFGAGAWVAVLSLYLFVLLADVFLAYLLGERLALTLACGLGWSVGGAVAGLARRLGSATLPGPEPLG